MKRVRTHLRLHAERGRDGPKYFSKTTGRFCWPDAYGGYNGVWWLATRSRARGAGRRAQKMVEARKRLRDRAGGVRVGAPLYAVEHRGRTCLRLRGWNCASRDGAAVGRPEERRSRLETGTVAKSNPMAEALNYVLGQWGRTERVFCSDGAVPIDNNVSEREMKRGMLNRKNSAVRG